MIEMPEHASIISAGIQNDQIVIWAVVAPDYPITKRLVIAVNTGDFYKTKEVMDFVGTVTSSTGIVWHVFVSKLDLK